MKPTAGWASARRVTASLQWAHSVASVRRNLRRAGVLKNSSSMVTVVPAASAAGDTGWIVPPSTSMRHACGRPAARDASAKRETAAIDASASPRKPSVPIASRSAGDTILDVACLATASARSSRSMPPPSSATRRRLTPPPATSMSTCVRTGVEAVLDQLLERRGGPLDDLARRDLVDQLVGKRPDNRHG